MKAAEFTNQSFKRIQDLARAAENGKHLQLVLLEVEAIIFMVNDRLKLFSAPHYKNSLFKLSVQLEMEAAGAKTIYTVVIRFANDQVQAYLHNQ